MKGLKLTLIFAILIFALNGCGEKSNVETGTPDATQTENNEHTEEKVIKSQTIADNISGLTEVISYVGDCDGDGTDETVVLATSADRDSKGEFLWNDGQNWSLYVRDNAEKIYVLFDGFVQAGNVYFDVADYYMSDGAKPAIMVTVSTGAGLSIKNYTFSKDDNGYIEKEIYDTRNATEGGINRRFTSVPEILK
ncbi:MAG: hypothetical protein IKW62_00680 [Clostridia bacterium]|nr:hypothetical protein [Clostridia bacterium]